MKRFGSFSQKSEDSSDETTYWTRNSKWLLLLVLLLFCCVFSSVAVAGVTYAVVSSQEKPVECREKSDVPMNFSKKTSMESSSYKSFNYSVSNAQDGNIYTCTHTSVVDPDDNFPWWQIDLVDQYVVVSASLHIRLNCCPERNHDLEMRVGNFLEQEKNVVFDSNGLCGEFPGGGWPRGFIFNFTCPTMLVGRYVTIQKVRPCAPGVCSDKNLSVCEVAIDAFKLEVKE